MDTKGGSGLDEGKDDDMERGHGRGGGGGHDVDYDENLNSITCGCIPRILHGRLFGCIQYFINPTVMFLAIAIIWSFVIWVAVDVHGASEIIADTQQFVVNKFTWLYVLTLLIFGAFCIFLIMSKYGSIQLGEDPPYTLLEWFSMLFSAGMGVGLYFFGIAEPVFHLNDSHNGKNRWYDSQLNIQAVDAMNLSWFHWGFTASACYCIAALPLAYHHHLKKEPLRESVCFVALIGQKYVDSFIGNIIDLVSVIGTMFGVSTSLGLGVQQINAGLHFIFDVKEDLDTQLVIIWIITFFATVSVVSGVDKGIKLLSELFIIFSAVIMLYLFFAGDSIFFLNNFIQTTGYFIQWMFELTFSTQAYELAGFYDKSYYRGTMTNGPKLKNWMSAWTTFYWAWWIAWAPFVGIFLAKISKGRTIREFIIGNMMVPTLLTCIWFTILGGFGLYNEMAAIQLGVDCVGNTSPSAMFRGRTIKKLSCYRTPELLFAALETLPFAKFTSVITLCAIVLGFVTSSDSASLVIDVLTASGNEKPPKIQRVFWALSEGAVASALLAAAPSGKSLVSLQTASLVAGLPICVLLLFELMSTYKSLRIHMGELNPNDLIYWKYDLFSVYKLFPDIIFSFFCPPYYQTKSAMQLFEKQPKTTDEGRFKLYLHIFLYWAFWGATIILLFCDFAEDGLYEYALTIYCLWIFISIRNRRAIKTYYGIDSSNMLFDFLSWIFCWYFAALQEKLQTDDTTDDKDTEYAHVAAQSSSKMNKDNNSDNKTDDKNGNKTDNKNNNDNAVELQAQYHQ